MFVNQIHDCSVISLTDLKGHVGYCHHLASGVGVGAVMVLVVVHKLLHFNLLLCSQTWNECS